MHYLTIYKIAKFILLNYLPNNKTIERFDSQISLRFANT